MRIGIRARITLTFLALVGLGILSTGAYTILVLRRNITEQALRRLHQEAAWVLVESPRWDPESIRQWARSLSLQLDRRITIAVSGQVLVDVYRRAELQEGGVFEAPEVRALREGLSAHSRREEPGWGPMIYVALRARDQDRIVRIGMPERELFVLVQQMRWVIYSGMLFSLLLTALASWIVSNRVTEPIRQIARGARTIAEGDLAHRIVVRQRTELGDLAEDVNRMAERLRSQIQELRRLAQLQNEFLGNVSHEVKNPLFALQGYVEALASETLSEEQRREFARRALRNVERLNRLFSDLIEISRLEYREDVLHRELFDLQELVREVVETILPRAQAKGLELHYDNPPTLVYADRLRMQQVLVNLIENAVAYTDAGHIWVRLLRRGERVIVEVEDTGRGIAPEHLPRIFDRFYRVDKARSRREGGTGLGLSIVKKIVEAHGSRVEVWSRPGQGSRFWFALPTRPEAEEGQG
mgnify:CR=1 FL=1|jgi:signal transduction histidine kinase|nr:MAG: two-component sensor histidine kinase [Bacteroidota bacterium]